MKEKLLSNNSRKLFGFLPALAAVLFGFSSCMPDNSGNGTGAVGNPVGDETLTASSTELLFAKDGGNESVAISGADNWDFISSEGETGWIKIAKSGNNLDVTVEPNLQGVERAASIMVISKTSNVKINVTQSAADFVLNFSEGEVVFNATGGEKTIVADANATDWQFEPVPEDAASWLSLTKAGNIVILKAQPNNSNDARETSLVVKAGTTTTNLVVRQMGAQKYFIPYEVPSVDNYNPMDIIRFEQARGNLIVGFAEPQEVEAYFPGSGIWQFQPGVINVVTGSPTSNVIVYNYETVESAKTGYTNAMIPVYYSDEKTKPEKAEFIAYLKENGFTAEDETETSFVSASNKLKVVFDETQAAGLIAKFTPNFEQPSAFPTWETIPMGKIHQNLDFMRNPDVKADQIREMEVAAGSELIADQETAIAASTGMSGLDEGYRFYFFGTADNVGSIGGDATLVGSVIQYDLFFDNPNYAIWLAGSEWVVTDEFKALLQNEGWSFLGVNQGFIQYYKDIDQELSTVMLISTVEDPMVFDGKQGVRISRIVYPASQIHSVSTFTLREIFEGKAGDINYALQSPLQRKVWEIFTQNNRKLFKK